MKISVQSSVQSPLQKYFFGTSAQKITHTRSFSILSNFVWFLNSSLDILHSIVDVL